MSVNGNIAVNTLSLNSTYLNVNYARLAGLPGGDDSQATFMNKDQYFPNETLAEQIKKYCVMQDINGISHLNSPTKFILELII